MCSTRDIKPNEGCFLWQKYPNIDVNTFSTYQTAYRTNFFEQNQKYDINVLNHQMICFIQQTRLADPWPLQHYYKDWHLYPHVSHDNQPVKC